MHFSPTAPILPLAPTMITKFKPYLRTALALCLLGGIVGCSSVNTENGVAMTPDKIAQIKKGVTTRAQIEALFGPPDNVAMMPEGKRVMSYNYTATNVSGHPNAASFIPYVGLFAGGAKAEGQTRMQKLQIMLNPQGIVDDFEFSDNTKNLATTTGGFMGVADQTSSSSTQPTASK
jgi:hypothetical protein